MAGNSAYFRQDAGPGRNLGQEESHRQTAQFFYQSQETSGRQTAPSHLQKHHIKSAPMISKRFLQLLDQNSGSQIPKETFLPQMNKARPIRTSQPPKSEMNFDSKSAVYKEKSRGMSAQEIDQYPTDISFDGKPTNGVIFRRKLKSTSALKKNPKLFLKENPNFQANAMNSTRKTRDPVNLRSSQ